MLGVIDVGGGMRGAYAAGVFDCMLDRGISADYCLGVSVGSANAITYTAAQRGRTRRFYTEYAGRKEYMSLQTMRRCGSYINLDYIFSTLSNHNGEDPLAFDVLLSSGKKFVAVATDADTGNAVYFTSDDMRQDDYTVLKASCCIPVVCKPVKLHGRLYYDGGIADPIPVEKAFADGCEKLIVILSRPADEYKKRQKMLPFIKLALREYSCTAEKIATMAQRYNESLDKLMEYERRGMALIVAPKTMKRSGTLSKNKEYIESLYNSGYCDAEELLSKNNM